MNKDLRSLQVIYDKLVCLKESMTFWIPDIPTTPSNLHDLCYQLNHELAKYIRQNVDYDIFLSDRVVPDGGDYDKTSGIINLYTHKIPKILIPKGLSLLKYYIVEYGGELLSDPIQDISNMTKDTVYRFKVKILNPNSNPPELNLSNMNAVNIMNLLGYGYSESYEISAKELLMKIETIENNNSQIQNYTRDEVSDGKFHIGGQTFERIKVILSKIKEICEYAIENNITYITVS